MYRYRITVLLPMICLMFVLICIPDVTLADFQDASEDVPQFYQKTHGWVGSMLGGLGVIISWIATLFNLNETR